MFTSAQVCMCQCLRVCVCVCVWQLLAHKLLNELMTDSHIQLFMRYLLRPFIFMENNYHLFTVTTETVQCSLTTSLYIHTYKYYAVHMFVLHFLMQST